MKRTKGELGFILEMSNGNILVNHIILLKITKPGMPLSFFLGIVQLFLFLPSCLFILCESPKVLLVVFRSIKTMIVRGKIATVELSKQNT